MLIGKLFAISKPAAINRMNHDQVFLFLTHIYSKEIAREFEKLQEATKALGTCILLYQQKSGRPMDRRFLKFPHYIQTDMDLVTLSDAPYFADSPACFKPDRSLIAFSRKHRYGYYWLIEYDVRFSGNWEYFFRYFSESPEDFLTSHIRRYVQEPDWYFWGLDRFDEKVDLTNALRSFNPIFRISGPALDYVYQIYLKGWTGIYEALIPTLLFQGNFTLRDFGGTGDFVLPQDINRFYLDSSSCELLDGKTMRYRPPHNSLSGYPVNKLVHPVKPRSLQLLLKTAAARYFDISIVIGDWLRFVRVTRSNGLREAWRLARSRVRRSGKGRYPHSVDISHGTE